MRTVSVGGGPRLPAGGPDPAGGPELGATPVAKTWSGARSVGADRLSAGGLRERGARVGAARSPDPLATSPKGKLQ
eukprot:3294884-Heterocapsa_arctica.AAC.1